MSQRGLMADEQRGQTRRVRTSTVDQQDALAPDPSLPAKALDRSACTVVLWQERSGWPRAPVLAIGLRSSGIKKECPEIDGRASCRLGILVLPAGWLLAPSPPVCQRECVAAVSQCPPVSGLPGARLGGGGTKAGSCSCRAPSGPAPMYAKGSNDSDADADSMLDHAISGQGCEYLTGQDYPDTELRASHSRQPSGWDRSPGCLDMPCLRASSI